MKLTLSAVLLSLTALASAIAIEGPDMAAHRREVLDLETRQGKAVPVGACCTPNVSKKEDVCTTGGGAAGKCVPANSAGCNAALTCIANTALTCDANTLENGKPTCRPKAGA